jgi:hypothetical protein
LEWIRANAIVKGPGSSVIYGWVGLGTGSETLCTDSVAIVIGPGRIVSASELVSSVYGWVGMGTGSA